MKRLTLLMAAVFCLTTYSFALNPSREYSQTPKDYDMDYEEVTFTTEDGIQLYGWSFKPMSKTKKYILICDDGIGNMADNLEVISQFLALDFNVFAFDYRGYGKSGDYEIFEKDYIIVQFLKDISAAIVQTRKLGSGSTTFDVYGIGMGAGLALSVAANKTEIRRVIADAPYTSFGEIKSRLKDKKDKEIDIPKVFNKYYFEPIYALTKGNHLTGILYICGGNDVIISPTDLKGLVKMKKKISSMYVVKGSTNKENFTSNKEEYFAEIKKFLG
ncbi:MAG: hypothetical protein COC01_03845 [Bacteroidetes bacterium]|nr:MAG: hypothetical protein COC01_03845 [Bacteroidota bacterium]